MKKIKTPYLPITALLALLLSSTTQAEEIIIPIASQGSYLSGVERPHLGEKRHDVARRFGEPVIKHPTTGNPPITRWDYENFSVYFESDVVLHSVLKHRRADGLNNQ